MDSKFLIIWVNSGLTTKSSHVNAPYHFVHIGEVFNYIKGQLNEQIDLLDVEAEEMQFQDIIRKIIKNKYKAIAFYTNTENLQNSINLLNIIKQIVPNVKTIVYGEMPIYLPEFFNKTNFDAIVDRKCDQEVAILDYFNYSMKKRKKDDLRGVIHIENKALIKSKDGCYLEPNDWGFPEKDEIPIEKYYKMEGKQQIVLTIARGCPYNSNWN